MSGTRLTARDVGLPVTGLTTGQVHDITVVRTAVPIVFVPGIMGGRLGRVARNGPRKGMVDVVWDPDDAGYMLGNFFSVRSRAAAKRQLLVGDQYDPNDLVPFHPWHLARRGVDGSAASAACAEAAKYGMLTPDEVARGWTSLSLGSYRPVLAKLQDRDFLGRLPAVGGAGGAVIAPLHAFGYNWTASCSDSGKLLAAYVRELVQQHRAAGRECPGAVLVTHSMGGLVARAACVQHGLAASVVGVIHGVQPSNGAAAAYWRMKAGFPRAEGFGIVKTGFTARVLGTDGAEVTALLGNMPGGLELLPNQLYEPEPGNGAWLFWPDRERTTALPQRGDPYGEVYLERRAPWRLISDERWLDPGGSEERLLADEASRAAARGVGAASRTSWDGFEDRVLAAKALHASIGGHQHPRTASFYGTGVSTPATVRFDASLVEPPLASLAVAAEAGSSGAVTADAVCRRLTRQADREGGYAWYTPMPVGGRTDYPMTLGRQVWRYALRPAVEDGDGTVPTESGRALCAGPDGPACAAFAGVEHEPAYHSPKVQTWITNRVVGLIKFVVGAGAGRPG